MFQTGAKNPKVVSISGVSHRLTIIIAGPGAGNERCWKNLKLNELPDNVKKACYLRAVLKNSVIDDDDFNSKYALYLLIELLKFYDYDSVFNLCNKFEYYIHFEDEAKSWLED